MKLSKHATAIYKSTNIPASICQVIGQFCNYDIFQKPGDLYFTLQCGGRTFFRDRWSMLIPVGNNRLIHMYKVQKTTPCSVLAEYLKTMVISHGYFDDIYKYHIRLGKLENKLKRFFPTRSLEHKQKHFCEYANLEFYEIPKETQIERRGYNFILG